MQKPIKKTTTYKGKLFTVTKETFLNPHKVPVTYERVYRVPSVYVLPLLTPNKIILIKEWRISRAEYVWRIPAGRVDKEKITNKNFDSATLKIAAQRELQEESGYRAKSLKQIYKRFVGESIQAPAYVYLAKDLIYDPLPQDSDEKITTKTVSLKKAYEMSLSGEIGEELMALTIIRLYKKTL